MLFLTFQGWISIRKLVLYSEDETILLVPLLIYFVLFCGVDFSFRHSGVDFQSGTDFYWGRGSGRMHRD